MNFVYFKNIISKYFGKIEYVVTIVNVSGNVRYSTFHKMNDVNEFIVAINNEKYWNIQKIEKYRKYNFLYENEIVHSPLFFVLKNVTENERIMDINYSFLKKDKSLKIINRIINKGL